MYGPKQWDPLLNTLTAKMPSMRDLQFQDEGMTGLKELLRTLDTSDHGTAAQPAQPRAKAAASF